VKIYSPLASVSVVATIFPFSSIKLTVTPEIPFSPAFCKPLLFKSLKAKPVIVPLGSIKPASISELPAAGL